MRLSATPPARSLWYAVTRGPKPPSGAALSMRAASDRPARGRAPIRATPEPRERPQAGDHLQSPQPWRNSGVLPRTPSTRSSENSTSRHLGEAFSTVPHPPKPGHIAQRVNARGFAYATCCTLQLLVARQRRGRSFGIESTADALLTKPSTLTSWFSRFYGFCRKIKEPTSGLEPLTCSLRVSCSTC